MKRKVNARPTMRGCPERIGRVPLIQTRRNPCLSRTVVIVAVDTGFSASMMSLNSLILPPVGSVQARRARRELEYDSRFGQCMSGKANPPVGLTPMCNDYRLVTNAATLFEGFSETRIKIRFSEGTPNIEAREDIKITDTAPIVRAVDGEPGGRRPRATALELARAEPQAGLQFPLGRPRIRLGPVPHSRRRLLRVHRSGGQEEEAEGQVAVHQDGRAVVLRRRDLAGRQAKSARPSRC